MPTPAEWHDPEYRARLHDAANGTRTYPDNYCRDDCIAPGGTPFACTLHQGHSGDHEAWGTAQKITTWPRGEGRRNVWGV